MSGHTPGPWRVRVGPRDGQDECDLAICGDIFVIADLRGPQYAHCYSNARLIAASPLLLAALKLAQGHLSEQLDCKRCHPIGHCPVLDSVNAAIAAAEGEPS